MHTPLLLIPGMLCDARLWAAQRPVLEKICELEVPDIAAYDAIETAAASILSAAPEHFALGGLSMGGYIALEMMRQLGERGEMGRVEKLMLIATSAYADTPEQTRVRKGLIHLARLGKFKGVTPKLLPTLVHPSRVEEPAVTEVIFAMAETIGLDGFIRQETAVMNRRDQSETLGRIRCPTLILCGDGDLRTPPECSRAIQRAIAGAEFHLLETCGHLPPLEMPEETARLMTGFLAGA